MADNAVNDLAILLQQRMSATSDKPPMLDFGSIQDDMSLLTNKFPKPIPITDYVICRSVCYDPAIPLSMTCWYEESWNKSEWLAEGQQPQEWEADRWGELQNYWDEKHKTPPFSGPDHMHNSKGGHSHDEDTDGIHYHYVNLPKKMYRIQPGDRVLVAWVGDDAVVVDIIMAATEAM